MVSAGDIKHSLVTGLSIQSRSALHLNIPNVIGQSKSYIIFSNSVFTHGSHKIVAWAVSQLLQANVWLITVASAGCVGPESPWKSPSFMQYYITSVYTVQCKVLHNSYHALESKTCRSKIKKAEVKYNNKIITVRSKSRKMNNLAYILGSYKVKCIWENGIRKTVV
jgi:hypothetical protein